MIPTRVDWYQQFRRLIGLALLASRVQQRSACCSAVPGGCGARHCGRGPYSAFGVLSCSRAERIPSAPGLTPSGERWLHRTIPLPSITKRARADSPIFSLNAPNCFEIFPLGSKSERTGKLSLRSLAKAKCDQILSTEIARSSALNFLNSGITLAYSDSWSVHTGLQSAG